MNLKVLTYFIKLKIIISIFTINQLIIHQNYWNPIKNLNFNLSQIKNTLTIKCNEELMKQITNFKIKIIDKNGSINKSFCYYINKNEHNNIMIKKGNNTEIKNFINNINIFTNDINEIIYNNKMSLNVILENKSFYKSKKIMIIPNNKIYFNWISVNLIIDKKIKLGNIDSELGFNNKNLSIELKNKTNNSNILINSEINKDGTIEIYFNNISLKYFNKISLDFRIIDNLSKEKSELIHINIYKSFFYRYLIDFILLFFLVWILLFFFIVCSILKNKKIKKKVINNLNETEMKEDILTKSILNWNKKYLDKFKNKVGADNIEDTINRIRPNKNMILQNNSTILKNNELSLYKANINDKPNFSLNMSNDISVIKKTIDPNETNIYKDR